MDTHMPTTMDTTMERGPLMPSPLPLLSPRLMLMLSTDTTDTDTHMPTTMDTTMERGPLMPSPLPLLSPRLMLMLSTDTTDTDTDLPTMDMDMPTTDTMDTHMP